MTVCSLAQGSLPLNRLLDSRTLPHGWRVLNARAQPAAARTTRFFISPTGKRFQSLQAAKAWLVSQQERQPGPPNGKVRHNSTVQAGKQSSAETRAAKDRAGARDLPASIKKRRKAMSLRNPFANLLRTTLIKNYKEKRKIEKEKKRQKCKMIAAWITRKKEQYQKREEIFFKIEKNKKRRKCKTAALITRKKQKYLQEESFFLQKEKEAARSSSRRELGASRHRIRMRNVIARLRREA